MHELVVTYLACNCPGVVLDGNKYINENLYWEKQLLTEACSNSDPHIL